MYLSSQWKDDALGQYPHIEARRRFSTVLRESNDRDVPQAIANKCNGRSRGKQDLKIVIERNTAHKRIEQR
jgi:hypothetical protein